MGNEFDDAVDASGVNLTTLAKIKLYLDIDEATWDTVLGNLQNGAEDRIENYCGVDGFASATRTEQIDGRGSSRLVLKNRPIISIATVHDSTSRTFGASALIASTDYTFYDDSGLLQRTAGAFVNGIRNVQVVYVAGYATIPDDLQLAVCKLVGAYWNQMRQGADGITTEREADYNAAYEKVGMPEDVTRLLDPYANVGIGT